MEGFIICKLHQFDHCALAKVLFSRISQSYVSNGGGFNGICARRLDRRFPTLFGVVLKGDSDLQLPVRPELKVLCSDQKFKRWHSRLVAGMYSAITPDVLQCFPAYPTSVESAVRADGEKGGDGEKKQ